MEFPKASVYHVHRIAATAVIHTPWNQAPWAGIPSLKIDQGMGNAPAFTPDVQAKLAYDARAIYVIFQVHDQYVRAVVEDYNGPVSRDSCVEFFFTPGGDSSAGYFNLEINCGGTALFAYQQAHLVGRINIPPSDFTAIEIAHSMPRRVEPEITTPVTWTLAARVPFAVLDRYTDVTLPTAGVQWRANLYKIAAATSNPHYLTWSYVDHPTPQFHVPACFGTLCFT